MKTIFQQENQNEGLSLTQVIEAIRESITDLPLEFGKVLLIVPDFTRANSYAGPIANTFYHDLKNDYQVDILIALGTHMPMNESECSAMYGDIPFERFIMHDWRHETINIGEVPSDFIYEVSEGLMNDKITVEVNKNLWNGYDRIISIGQIVPHEVVGMANHSKNILVGCGGSKIINFSHMLGAVYGMERMMGKDHTPVRKVLDYAATMFLKDLPIYYVLTVTTAPDQKTLLHGLFMDEGREGFEKAVVLSQEKNLTLLDEPLRKVIVYLDEHEFKSTWLGNKAIYRTRMAIADGGELIILAPGVKIFGEDEEIDRLIRRYGYVGRDKILKMSAANNELKSNLSAAAHLIHGSSDDRFKIVYCTKFLNKEAIEGVNFSFCDYDEAVLRYNPNSLHDGVNVLADGEEVFFISNPALGLWADKSRF